MNKKAFYFTLIVICIHIKAFSQFSIIPYPNKLNVIEGQFEFKGNLYIDVPDTYASEIQTINEIFIQDFRVRMLLSGLGNVFVTENKQLQADSYKLNVSTSRISIECSNGSGCFYAFQTIRQLMQLTTNGAYTIAACSIEDSPSYTWRGFMLDEARNFKGKKVVKEILDQMALLKMNVFHWHLTDDQGWRIEIKKFPLLTEVGAFRDSTRLRKMVWRDERWHWVDSEVYSDRANGGYYTQEDIRELVAYASARHITVIPEIEMPGHATAAIAAYPWLMYPPKQVKVPSSLGIKKLAYNVADEKVIGFLQDVILEVMELFPGKILHIGGDEVKYDTWKDNSAIKKLMEKEKLKNYADVQIHFTNQISTFIEKNGFRMMGWNEILGNVHVEEGEKSAQLELSKKSIINFWKGDSLLFIDALTKGYDVVNARSIYTYLDFPGKRTPISVAYNFSPAPRGITNEQRKHVLGFGCYMWGETSPTVRLMQGYTFPRIAAYAEAGWTRDINKDFVRFSSALVRMKEYWDKKGIYYKEE